MKEIAPLRRNTRVDVMKAILIILVVIGHSNSPWTTYIYLFHMPAFFVLSGYTYRGGGIGKYFLKKFVTIIIPALIINLIYIAFYSVMRRIGIYEVFASGEYVRFTERVSRLLLWWETPDFGGATWFLLVLFWIACIAVILDFVMQKMGINKYLWISLLIVGICGYILAISAIPLPYYLDLAMLGCFYYGCGVFIQKIDLLSYLDYHVMLPFCIISMVFFGSFYFYGEISMNWPTRSFSHPFIQLWSCFASVYILWWVAGVIDITKINSVFLWLGRHTYCILILHFAMFRFLFGIAVCVGKVPLVQLQHLTPDIGISHGGGWIIISAMTILLCSAIAKVAENNRWSNYIFNARVPFAV